MVSQRLPDGCRLADGVSARQYRRARLQSGDVALSAGELLGHLCPPAIRPLSEFLGAGLCGQGDHYRWSVTRSINLGQVSDLQWKRNLRPCTSSGSRVEWKGLSPATAIEPVTQPVGPNAGIRLGLAERSQTLDFPPAQGRQVPRWLRLECSFCWLELG